VARSLPLEWNPVRGSIWLTNIRLGRKWVAVIIAVVLITLYANDFTSVIDIYFYETFFTPNL
jgi:hypothetical protein